MTVFFATFLLAVSFEIGEGQPAQFIEGFPSIPLLDGFLEQEESRMVFDTVAGTIAEVQLETDHSDGLARYEKALSGLGHGCTLSEGRLRCIRGAVEIRMTELKAGAFRLKASPIPASG